MDLDSGNMNMAKLAATTSRPEIQRILAEHQNDAVRRALATNPTLTEEVQLMLADDFDSVVRANLAANRGISNNIRRKLQHDDAGYVREYLASNVENALDVQEHLAADSFARVRENLAMHTSNIRIQSRLSADPEDGVRWCLAVNENCEPSVLLSLCFDNSPKVREAALWRLKKEGRK